MISACTPTTETECGDCLAGTASIGGTVTECTPCNVDGKYSISDNASFCLTAKAGYKPREDRKGEEQCAAGTYSTGGTDDCLECGEGETSSAGAAGCSTCATCATGRYLISTCTPTTETQCGDCLKGEASMGGSTTECTDCNTDGQYSDRDLASACKTASAGSKPTADRTNIETCPKNTFSIGANDKCTQCIDGGHSLPGSSSCEKCSTGKYYDEEANTCESCPLGKFTATGENDINNCKDCDAGFISNDPDGAGFCSPCKAGFYSNSDQTECLPCAPGFVSGIAASQCTACEIGKFAEGFNNTGCSFCDDKDVLKGSTTKLAGSNSSSSCQCEAGEYKSDSSDACEVVFEGVSTSAPGQTVNKLTLEKGFWRTSSASTEILPCLNEDHCLGGSDPSSYCAEGYTGPLCAVCSSGYAAIGAGESLSCNQCSGSSTATVAAGVTFVVVILSVSIIQLFRDKDSTRGRLSSRLTSIDSTISAAAAKFDMVQPYIKVVFAYYQVVGGLGFLFGIKFPPIFSSVISIFGGMVSLDFISFLPLGCMAPAHFYNTLLVYTLVPLLTSIILIGSYFVLRKRTDRRSVFLRNKLFEVFLAMTFILLPSISVKIFSTFACHHFDDGTSFLTVDYSIDCNASEHTFYRGYAGAMILIYPIGIPFSYWFLLWRRRHLLNGKQREKEEEMSEEKALKEALELRAANEEEHQSLKALSFLYGSYEPKYWWFEVFETLRKLALTGFLVFLAPGTAAQVSFSMIMCMGAMRIYAGCKVRTGEAFTSNR
jgi:hypothetical protein